jgi:hypothetical protein
MARIVLAVIMLLFLHSCYKGPNPNVHYVQLSILYPDPGQVIQNGESLMLQVATEPVAVDHVYYYLDAQLIGQSTVPSKVYNWIPQGVSQGSHTFKAVAVTDGNVVGQSEIIVFFN